MIETALPTGWVITWNVHGDRGLNQVRKGTSTSFVWLTTELLEALGHKAPWYPTPGDIVVSGTTIIVLTVDNIGGWLPQAGQLLLLGKTLEAIALSESEA